MTKQKVVLVLIFCLLQLCTNEIYAQVTIGSSLSPNRGALLDLKDGTPDVNHTGVTAQRGLGLPRVELQANGGDLGKSLDANISINESLDKEEHIGLLVYNTGRDETSAAARLCPGLHVWDGNKWQPVTPYPTIIPTKTIVSIDVIAEGGRENITGTEGYEPGPLGQFTDTRGPSGVETNLYHHARFYAYKVDVTEGSITYKGIRNPNVCDLKNAVEETWTEQAPFQYVDDGIWMTENLRTMYATTTATTPLPVNTSHSNTTTYAIPLYAAIKETNISAADKLQEGLLYNWAAATNNKGKKEVVTGIDDGWGNIDNPNKLDESHSLQKKRQGICPDGWYLPSDKDWNELEAVIASSSNTDYTNTNATPYIWKESDNKDINPRGKTHGKTMTSVRFGGDSKPASAGGFNALFVGSAPANEPNNNNYGTESYFWTSSSSSYFNVAATESATAWPRVISRATPMQVTRIFYLDRTVLSSVRCRK